MSNLNKNRFLKSPEFKTLLYIFTVIISSVLTNTFTTEITDNSTGQIIWSDFYKSFSFWIIIVYIISIYIYHKYIHKRDKKIFSFSNEEYIDAYIKSEIIPKLLEKSISALNEGNFSEFTKLTKEIKKAK